MTASVSPKSIAAATEAIAFESARPTTHRATVAAAIATEAAALVRHEEDLTPNDVSGIATTQNRHAALRSYLTHFDRWNLENRGRLLANAYITTHQKPLAALLKGHLAELEKPREGWLASVIKLGAPIYERLLLIGLNEPDERGKLELRREKLETDVANKDFALTSARNTITRFESLTNPTVEDWSAALCAVNSISFS